MTDTRNVKVFLVAHPVGILCDAFAEATTEPINSFASSKGRGGASETVCTARVVAKGESFAKRHYLTEAENRDLTLYHQARICRRDVAQGRGDARSVRVAHVWKNLTSWLKGRDKTFAQAVAILGPGWWHKSPYGSKDLAEFSCLLRCLEHALTIPADSHVSAYTDEAIAHVWES